MSEHYAHPADFYDERGCRHHHVRVVDVDDDHHRAIHDSTDGCAGCEDHTRAADPELEAILEGWRSLEEDMHAAVRAVRHAPPWGCLFAFVRRLKAER